MNNLSLKNRVRQFACFVIFAVHSLSLSFVAAAAELSLTGVIRAQEEVILKSEFAGIVQRIAVKEGERAREGQLLVELRNERHKISVDLTRARLEKAAATVAETRVMLDNAEKEFKRFQMAGDAVSRKDLEDKSDQFLRLKSNLLAQQAELAQSKEELKLRENELKETQLLAPFTGAVTQIFIHRGDTLKPTETQVLELVALDRLYVEVLLPVAHVHDVAIGQKVTIHAEGDGAKNTGTVQGQISHINPKVDAASRTFQVKVSFTNVTGRIRPGMLAQLLFPFAKK